MINLKLLAAGLVSTVGVYSYAIDSMTPTTTQETTQAVTDTSHASLSRDTIKSAQQRLSQEGFTVVDDGIIGSETTSAITRFQASRGLAKTGLFDDSTLTALGVANDTSTRAPASVNSSAPNINTAPSVTTPAPATKSPDLQKTEKPFNDKPGASAPDSSSNSNSNMPSGEY